MTKDIFKVDVKGLRELQAGKPKWTIIRELLANALDEEITECKITFSYEGRKATIIVEDDCPEGFVDLSDSFTLFKTTRKRLNPNQRGRYNLGEKQVVCLCDYARIISTTGGVEFDVLNEKRISLRRKRERGSEVLVVVRMTKDEYSECIEYCKQILSPKRILVQNNSCMDDQLSSFTISSRPVWKIFAAKLRTEFKDKESGEMKSVVRQTEVHLHRKENTGGVAYIYELGIPICEIDCDYSIDIQQKVPLSSDRDNVDGKYLKTLYGEVLNYTCEDIEKEQSSNMWVREATTSDRVDAMAVKSIVDKRYGKKVVIANPFDPISIDDAISNGFRVVHGSEMNSDEWKTIKDNRLIRTSTEVFGKQHVGYTESDPTENQIKIEKFVKKIANELLGINLNVEWIKSPQANVRADYGNSTLRFNLSKLPQNYWEIDADGYICSELLDLIIHELGHSKGNHTEQSYHKCITYLGAALATKALKNPEWFKI